jgi:hypothetical protein
MHAVLQRVPARIGHDLDLSHWLEHVCLIEARGVLRLGVVADYSRRSSAHIYVLTTSATSCKPGQGIQSVCKTVFNQSTSESANRI